MNLWVVEGKCSGVVERWKPILNFRVSDKETMHGIATTRERAREFKRQMIRMNPAAQPIRDEILYGGYDLPPTVKYRVVKYVRETHIIEQLHSEDDDE